MLVLQNKEVIITVIAKLVTGHANSLHIIANAVNATAINQSYLIILQDRTRNDEASQLSHVTCPGFASLM